MLVGLLDKEYPSLFRDTKRVAVGAGLLATLGWTTNPQSKTALKDETVRVLADDWLQIPCRDTITEMRGYVLDDKGKLTGSPHDDRVIALMLAVMMVRYAGDSNANVSAKGGPPKYSMEWWHSEYEYQKAARSRHAALHAGAADGGKVAAIPGFPG